MHLLLTGLIISGITIITFVANSYPSTGPILHSYFVLYIVFSIGGIAYYPFLTKHTHNKLVISVYQSLVFISTLLLIWVTGSFVSPFFYLLYLIAIVLAFIYSPLITMFFVITLVGLFYPNIGSIDGTIDLITMLALISVVPLTYYLQKEYLRLKQHEKKVLILNEEKSELKNKVEEMLANKIIRFAANIRQPVNDIKQIAYLELEKKTTPEHMKSAIKKISKLGQDSLAQIEEFETHVTGKKLLHTKK